MTSATITADAVAGHVAGLKTQDEVDTFFRQVRMLAAGAEGDAPAPSTADAEGYRAILTPYSEIDAKLTRWAWDERMPLGALSLMVGTEGLGKTAFGLRLAADLTRGALPGAFKGQPVMVALATPEDDAGATVKKRLMAAGGDVSKLLDLTIKRDAHARGVCLPEDTDMIVRALVQADVKFLFADPLASLLNPSKNSWKDTDIRDALEPLIGALAEHGITLLGSLHTNKSQSTDARQRGMGSAGWRQLARAAFLVGLDPDDPEGDAGSSRCVAHTKHNLGPRRRTVRFGLDTKPVQVEDVVQDAVFANLGEECAVTAAAMLAHEQGHEDAGQSKEDRAARWLYDRLEGGPAAVSVLHGEAEALGHAWRTVERAKKDAGVASFQAKGTGGWSWQLPGGGLRL